MKRIMFYFLKMLTPDSEPVDVGSLDVLEKTTYDEDDSTSNMRNHVDKTQRFYDRMWEQNLIKSRRWSENV
jgi:hypothetical protein